MSHFTKLDKANIVSTDAFVAACKELGFTEGVKKNCEIKDFYGQKIKADVAIPVQGYDIALVKNAAGKFDLTADWWAINSRLPASWRFEKSQASIQDAILRTTTQHTIVANFRRQGFMARVTEDAQHNLTVSLTR